MKRQRQPDPAARTASEVTIPSGSVGYVPFGDVRLDSVGSGLVWDAETVGAIGREVWLGPEGSVADAEPVDPLLVVVVDDTGTGLTSGPCDDLVTGAISLVWLKTVVDPSTVIVLRSILASPSIDLAEGMVVEVKSVTPRS